MDLQKFYMGVVFDAYEYFGAHIGEGGVPAALKLQSTSTLEELHQIHLLALTQIVTQVCAKARGHNGYSLAKPRTIC